MMPPQTSPVPGIAPPGDPLQGMMQQMIDQGMTRLPVPMSGPSGTTDYSLSMGYPEEDPGEELYQFDAIDRKNIKGLTPDKIRELGQTVYDLASEATQERRNGGRDENTERFRDLYEEVMEERRHKPWSDASEITTPDTRVQVETVAARITESLFSSNKWLKIKPGFPEDQPACEKCQDFAKSEMDGPNINLPAKFYGGTQTALVDGHVIGMFAWNRKRTKVRRRVLMNDATIAKMGGIPPMMSVMPGTPIKVAGKWQKYMQWSIIETDEVTQNCFDVKFLPMQDTFMWPATSPDLQEAVLFGHFVAMTPNEMLQRANAGYFDKKAVKEVIRESNPMGRGDEDGMSDTSQEAEERDQVSRSYEWGNVDHGRRKLACAYIRVHDADGDGEYEDLVIWIEWSTKKVIRLAISEEEDGIRPFKKLGFYPRVGGGFYDYSLVEKLFNTQMELNAVTRQGIDATSLALSKILSLEPGRRKLSDIEWQPGITMWDTTAEGTVKEAIDMPSVPSSNIVDRNDIRRMTEKISGADEVTQGVGQGQSSTLGQTNLAVAGGNIRLKTALLYGLDFLTFCYQRFFVKCLQHMEERATYEVIRNGKQTYPSISLDEIAVTQYATIKAYTSILDPEASLRAQKVELLFQVIANSPFVQNNFSRMGKLLTWYARAQNIDDDLSEFIGTEEEWEMMDMQFQEISGMRNEMMMAQGMPPELPGQQGAPLPRGNPKTSMGPQGMGPQSIPLNGGKPR